MTVVAFAAPYLLDATTRFAEAAAVPGNGGGSATDAPGLVVTGLEAPRIGELAASASVVLYELTPRLASLEEAFMELTADSVEYGDQASRAARGAEPAPQPAERSVR